MKEFEGILVKGFQVGAGVTFGSSRCRKSVVSSSLIELKKEKKYQLRTETTGSDKHLQKPVLLQVSLKGSVKPDDTRNS